MKWFLTLSILFLLPSISYGRSIAEIQQDLRNIDLQIGNTQREQTQCDRDVRRTGSPSVMCERYRPILTGLNQQKRHLQDELKKAQEDERQAAAQEQYCRNNPVACVDQKIADKEDEINNCRNQGRCAELKLELSDLKSERQTAERTEEQRKLDLETAEINAGIISEHDDAVDDIRKQHKKNRAYMAANTGAGFVFASKAHAACSASPVGTSACVWYGYLAHAAFKQARELYKTNKNMRDPELYLQDRSTLPDEDPDQDPNGDPNFNGCTGTSCPPGTNTPFTSITLNERAIEALTGDDDGNGNSLLRDLTGCDDCVVIDPDTGKMKFKNLEDIKVKQGDLNNLSGNNKTPEEEVMDHLKKNDPALFNQLKQLEKGGDLVKKDTKKSSVGSFIPGKTARSLAGNSPSRSSRYRSTNDSLDYKSAFDQFRKNKKNKFAGKTVTVGKDQVGVVQDNIFLMVHRRYQERRTQKQFIESQKKVSKRKAALGS